MTNPIARMLDISPKTVGVNRANVVRKMEVAGTTELLRLLSGPVDYLADKRAG